MTTLAGGYTLEGWPFESLGTVATPDGRNFRLPLFSGWEYAVEVTEEQ